MIPEEQIAQIKEQLFKQIETLPEDKQEQIREEIEEMSPEEFEEFLKQNKLIGSNSEPQCIFCLINQGKIPSFKIKENSTNSAILELNPLSKGHTLIVPKEHAATISESSKAFATEVSQLLKEKLNPKEVKISPLNIAGHALLEVVPIFGTEIERTKASEEDLKNLKQLLETKTIKEDKQEKTEEIKPEKPEEKQEQAEPKIIEVQKTEAPQPIHKVKSRIP